ncbi:MAG: GNAT family N-acetyltransferase [Clostridia bacterium]|nr:GNAT family N-acetyltransferase [Clostridia bacterium]
MKIELIPVTNKKYTELAEQLYVSAYPEFERKAFAYMLARAEAGLVELYAAVDEEGEFNGIAFTVPGEKVVYLEYVAVDPVRRGKGVGSAILGAVINQYQGKRIVADIETTLNPDHDMPVRMRRKSFYRRSGFLTMDYTVNFHGIVREVMAYPEEVSFEEYHELFAPAYGEIFASKVRKL